MKKVEIYKNEVKIFEGSMSKGSTFLGKDNKYLFRIYNGYTELKHDFPYNVFVNGLMLVPKAKPKRNTDLVKNADMFELKNGTKFYISQVLKKDFGVDYVLYVGKTCQENKLIISSKKELQRQSLILRVKKRIGE